MKSKLRDVGVALALGLLLVLMASAGVSADQPGEPLPGTVVGISGPYTFYGPTALTGTTTVYSSQPNTYKGQDISIAWLYNSADVFVTGDVSGTETITVTPQFSVDGTYWTDATYTYVADALSSTTTVITGTEGMTGTSTTSSSSAVTEATYQIVMSADGTDYLRLPLAGKYLRFEIEHSGSVTPTVKVLLRNN